MTLALWPFEWSFRFQILLKVGCCTCPRCKDKLWWSTLGPVGFFEARRFGSPGLDGSGCPVGRSWESTHGKILRRRKLLSYESYLTNLYLAYLFYIFLQNYKCKKLNWSLELNSEPFWAYNFKWVIKLPIKVAQNSRFSLEHQTSSGSIEYAFIFGKKQLTSSPISVADFFHL